MPPSKVTWFVNELEIFPSDHMKIIEDERTSVLVIVDLTPEDSGEYVCQAENPIGVTRCKTTLTVRRKCPPGFIPHMGKISKANLQVSPTVIYLKYC